MIVRIQSVILAACLLGRAAVPDARDIVRKTVAREIAAVEQRRDYTWLTDITEREFSSAGAVTSTKTRTTETLILYGKQFERVIARDGHALPADQEAKEKDRFDRLVAKRASLSERERQKDDAESVARERKAREFLLQIPDVFEFALQGEEIVRDRPAWVISVAPKPDAHPRGISASNLSKLIGRMWIDKAEERWVKIEAEARTTVRFGLFLGSLSPGSRVEFEQSRMADGTWLPLTMRGKFAARLVIKKINLEAERHYRDYRRFSSSSRVVGDDRR